MVRGIGGGVDIKNYLECQGGNIYKLGNIPVSLTDLKENEDIILNKTFLFSKIKSIQVVQLKSDKPINVSLFSNPMLTLMLFFLLILILLNVFFTNSALDFGLLFSSLFICSIAYIYLFYLN